MQTKRINIKNIASNQNMDEISLVQLEHQRAQQDCWKTLLVVNQYINLNNVEVLQLMGDNMGAYIALLARQFPTLNFEYDTITECKNSSRVLWINTEKDFHEFSDCLEFADAVIITHKAEEAKNVITLIDGFARIGAVRDVGNSYALSIFGRGLMRDIFKPKVRG